MEVPGEPRSLVRPRRLERRPSQRRGDRPAKDRRVAPPCDHRRGSRQDPGIVRRLLTSAVKVAKLHGVARVAAFYPQRSPLEASALAAGFLPRPSRFVVQAVDLRGGLPVGAEFQGGDFDVVDLAAAFQSFLRAGNGLGSLWAESVWEAGASLAGRLWGQRPALWKTHGRERVLVIAPHPDDEVWPGARGPFFATRAGDWVRIAVVTDGSGSGAGLDPEAMRARREEEERSGAALMGAAVDRWGLPRRIGRGRTPRPGWSASSPRSIPTVIYAPSQLDFHSDHRRVAQAVAATVSARPVLVRVYPIQVPLTPLVSNLLTMSPIRR